MKSELEQLYSKEERELLAKLDHLFDEWQRLWNGKEGWFIKDGFYPGYLKMNKKILFLGRDCYDVYDPDNEDNACACYISTFIPQYLKGSLGNKSINSIRFHKLMIKIAYGLLSDAAPVPWADVLDAASICTSGRIFHEVSFAFMNLGKLSHEDCDPVGVNADWKRIEEAVEFSLKGDNLIKKEIDLLSPDLIIAMNLAENPLKIDYYSKVFGDHIVPANVSVNDCGAYRLNLGENKTVPLLDCWHFSGRFSEEQYIYNPICNALKGMNFY